MPSSGKSGGTGNARFSGVHDFFCTMCDHLQELLFIRSFTPHPPLVNNGSHDSTYTHLFVAAVDLVE
jgi:hypothetical protein